MVLSRSRAHERIHARSISGSLRYRGRYFCQLQANHLRPNETERITTSSMQAVAMASGADMLKMRAESVQGIPVLSGSDHVSGTDFIGVKSNNCIGSAGTTLAPANPGSGQRVTGGATPLDLLVLEYRGQKLSPQTSPANTKLECRLATIAAGLSSPVLVAEATAILNRRLWALKAAKDMAKKLGAVFPESHSNPKTAVRREWRESVYFTVKENGSNWLDATDMVMNALAGWSVGKEAKEVRRMHWAFAKAIFWGLKRRAW